MYKVVRATYQDGILRPVEDLSLEEEQQVVVTDENRELLAYDGWTRYVEVEPEFFSPGAKRPEPLAS